MTSAPPYPFPGGTQGDEPPDPVAGQPGHFAWSRWIKEFVKRLDQADYVLDARIDTKLDESGGTVSGDLTVDGNLSLTRGLAVPTPTTATQAVNKGYVDRIGTGGQGSGSAVGVTFAAGKFSSNVVIPVSGVTQYGDNITYNSAEKSLIVPTADTYLFRYTVLSDSPNSNVLRHVFIEFKDAVPGVTTYTPLEETYTSIFAPAGFAVGGSTYHNGSFIGRPRAGNAYRLVGRAGSAGGGNASFKAVSFQIVRLGIRT